MIFESLINTSWLFASFYSRLIFLTYTEILPLLWTTTVLAGTKVRKKAKWLSVETIPRAGMSELDDLPRYNYGIMCDGCSVHSIPHILYHQSSRATACHQQCDDRV